MFTCVFDCKIKHKCINEPICEVHKCAYCIPSPCPMCRIYRLCPIVKERKKHENC